MESEVVCNPYEGIEFITASGRFAAYTTKLSQFPKRLLIGSFESLEKAVNARKAALESQTHE